MARTEKVQLSLTVVLFVTCAFCVVPVADITLRAGLDLRNNQICVTVSNVVPFLLLLNWSYAVKVANPLFWA